MSNVWKYKLMNTVMQLWDNWWKHLSKRNDRNDTV